MNLETRWPSLRISEETGQAVPVVGIAAIKILRDFLEAEIKRADFDETLDGLKRKKEGS